MSNEIATYSMILSKLSLGKSGTECPTKTQILAINSLIVIDNASTYGANECVKIDDIRKKVETWNYYLTVSPTSMSFGAGGGSKSFTVSSYKRKVLDGVEQSGDTSVSLKSTTISGTGFSLSGTTVSASANEITSNRTGTVTITQNESNKTVTISLSQDGDDVSSYGEWTISVSANPTSVSNSGGTSTITASAKRTVYWASGDVTEETGNPTLSTNLGSLSSSSSPSTLTLGENTSTSSRTATIKATHGGKSATCTVTQAGAEPTIEYVFTISPWQVNVGASGGTGDIGFTSYKLVNGNQISLGYSIDSSTLPSWATYSNGRFTISSNSSTSSRSANVYFTQSESGKRDYATISQSGYVPPADNYVFTWEDGSTSDVSASFPWDFSTNGTAANIPVVSTKNGSSQSWSVSSKPSWITTSTTSSKVTISASDNSGSARSGTIVLTQSGSNKTLRINVSQSAKPANTYSWQIKKSSEPNEDAYWRQSITYDVPAKTTGFSGGWSVKGRKNGEMFAEYTMSSDSPSWLTVSGTSYTVQHNTSSSSRSGTLTLTQAESGLECYIYINQSGYTPTYTFTYTFNVTPTNLSVTAAETNETLTVNSYKTVLKSDGSETTESLNYEFSSNASWVNAARTTTNTTYITVAQNLTTNQRSAKITLTQAESGAQVFINVIQSGTPDDYLSIFNSSISTTAEYTYINFKSSQPWSFSLDSVDIDNPVVIDKTSGNAGDNLTVALTYWRQYSRPRYIPYTIKQTAGQKLQAAGYVSFN